MNVPYAARQEVEGLPGIALSLRVVEIILSAFFVGFPGCCTTLWIYITDAMYYYKNLSVIYDAHMGVKR